MNYECAFCNVTFFKEGRRSQYCSAACKQRVYRIRHGARQRIVRLAPHRWQEYTRMVEATRRLIRDIDGAPCPA